MPTPSDAPTPRKRPRQARAQASWDAIVEASAQLLVERGAARLTTNAIAERAGVSIGSLYQYFSGRDAVIVALIERQQARQAMALADAYASLPQTGLADDIRHVVRAVLAVDHANPRLAAAIDQEEARLPVDSIVATTMGAAATGLTDILQRHRTRLTKVDIGRAARTLPRMTRTIIDAWTNLPDPDLQTAEDEAVRAILGYLTLADMT